jgi:hypothetical protein
MSTVTVNGNGAYNSDPTPNTDPSDDFIPAQPGTYYWTADYSGDATNDPSSSPCNATGESSVVT